MKSEPKENKEKGYMGAYFTEPTPISLSGKSNVSKTPTVEMFGADTVNLDSVLLCGEECVKVDPGPTFTRKISAAGNESRSCWEANWSFSLNIISDQFRSGWKSSSITLNPEGYI